MFRKLVLFLLIAIVAAALLRYYFDQQHSKNDEIILYGNVDVRQVDLSFRVSGLVKEIYFEEGDLVKTGDLVGILDQQPYLDQVKEAEANVESIKASLHNAEILFKRREELIGDGSISQEDLDNARSTKIVSQANLRSAEAALAVSLTNLYFTEAFAPTEGTILSRIREPGTVVKPSDPIYTLSVTSPVWVRAFVPEPYLGKIYPGMPAHIYTDSARDTVYKGHVGFISPVAEFTPKTVETTQLRTDLVYRLRIYADNPDHGLRQGMPVTVRLLQNAVEETPESPLTSQPYE
jgi:HlyD family secretion protein